jgi:hypothetical protein
MHSVSATIAIVRVSGSFGRVVLLHHVPTELGNGCETGDDQAYRQLDHVGRHCRYDLNGQVLGAESSHPEDERDNAGDTSPVIVSFGLAHNPSELTIRQKTN